METPGGARLGAHCPCLARVDGGGPDRCTLCVVVVEAMTASRASGRLQLGQSAAALRVTTPWEMAKAFMSALGQHTEIVVSSGTCDVNQLNILRNWRAIETAATTLLRWSPDEWEAFRTAFLGQDGRALYEVDDETTGTPRFNGINHTRNRTLHQGDLVLGAEPLERVKRALRAAADSAPPGVDGNALHERLDEAFDQQ